MAPLPSPLALALASGLAVTLAVVLAATVRAADAEPSATDRPQAWLEPTRFIDSSHPSIVETARAVTAGAASPRQRAVRLHDFVRDRIAFGWAPAFYDQKASEVLRSGVGFCNTKSTLFIALLRAAGIPARQRFVALDARILDGLVNPGTATVDHSFAEVHLDGRWLRVDSYILDRALAAPAQARLRAEGRVLGYGAHRDGKSTWDGRGDAFAQFVHPAMSTVDHGVFADVGDFYASGRGVNRLSWGVRLFFGVFARQANGRADALRAADGAPR